MLLFLNPDITFVLRRYPKIFHNLYTAHHVSKYSLQ
jgi:hypothetical protein